MAENEPDIEISSLIFIQIDGQNTTRVTIPLSKTAADLRTTLCSQDINLPSNVQFIDVNDYRVPVTSENSVHIRELVISSNNNNIVRLKTKKGSTTTTRPRQTILITIILAIFCLIFTNFIFTNDGSEQIMTKQLCSVLTNYNLSPLYDIFSCPTTERTNAYLEDQIIHVDNGTEVFVNHGTYIERVVLSDENYHYVSMYRDWVKNKLEYKKDYEWYTNMKSAKGHCAGHFDERVAISTQLIKDTPESIHKFSDTQFNDWPENLRNKIDIENRLTGTVFDDPHPFGLEVNGKSASNMYLVAWKRDNSNTIQIQTYVTTFERTAGPNCVFNPDYWSGQKYRITNAKKYFLLTEIETNPIYKKFFLGSGRK